MSSSPQKYVVDRLELAVTGAVAGLALYLLFELMPDLVTNRRLVLMSVTLGTTFFSVFLALLGPARLRDASLGAAAIAVPGTILFTWASFRFDDPEQFLEMGHAIVALSLGVGIATPFLAAALERDRGWLSYPVLFDCAWSIVVRYTAAGLFAGVVWAVLILSDALLSLVGVTIIEDLLEIDPVPWLISGVALGLGLAIVHELRDYVSAFVFIQLLRVLLPLLLVVLAVFIVALPMQGLSGLFGDLSPAATLAGVSFAAVTLISAVLHRDTEAETTGRFLRGAAQALALLIVVPAALAVYAVAVRIGQYGLTPDRVAAMAICVIILAYALAYAVAVVRRGDWMARMRRANLWLAVVTVAVSALWLTPVLNPERLSSASQVARARSGAAPDELPIWEFANEWGKAGERAMATLREMEDHPEHETLLRLLDRARTVQYEYQLDLEAGTEEIASLDGVIPLRPEGAALPEGALDTLSPAQRRAFHEACDRRTPGGGPGCVMIVAEFDAREAGGQAIAFWISEHDRIRVGSYVFPEDRTPGYGGLNGLERRLEPAVIDQILKGDFTLAPVEAQVLELDGMRLFP